MDLAAVMGLMIEPVRQGQCQWLLELLRCGYPLIGDGPRNAVVGKTVHKRNNVAVLGFPGRTQRVERFEQDGIKAISRVARAGKAPHPYPVGRQQMAQGTMDRLEERATIGMIL